MTSKHVLLLILSVIMAFPLAAQKEGGKRSRAEMRREFKEFKIKYIAQEIELGASQIQEFTELYSQMYDEKFSRLLTAKQVYKMKDAEEGFRRKMHEMRHKKAKGKKK